MNYHTGEGKKCENSFNVCFIDFFKRTETDLLYREQNIVSRVDNSLDVVPSLIPEDISNFMSSLNSKSLKQELQGFYVPSCIASSINLECPSSGTFARFALAVKTNPVGKKVLLGANFKPTRFLQLGQCSNDANRTAFICNPRTKLQKENSLLSEGLMTYGVTQSSSIVEIPHYGRLITDCAKMKVFAELVTRLHAEKHRCLVFCQMTKMIDILEDFMTWKKMSYFKMDGSTTI